MDNQSAYLNQLAQMARQGPSVTPQVSAPLAGMAGGGMPRVGPQGQPGVAVPQQQPQEPPEYSVRTDPAWAQFPVTHSADNADFLNALKPEQRAKILQMLLAHGAMQR